jgi:hypothetical protein
VNLPDTVIARYDFAGSARFALIEENEILDQIEQTPMVEHAIQQHLRLQAALISFVEAFPFGEVLPRLVIEP